MILLPQKTPPLLTHITLVPPRSKRANVPPPLSLFDPNDEVKVVHNVIYMITPVIDRVRKLDAGICTNININDVFRLMLSDLQDYVYKKYVKE